MKGTDRAIMVAFLAVAMLAGFYLMVLSPKREEAAVLGDDVTTLQAQITEQENLASFAQQARDDFPVYYGRMVTLGKAVPEGADTASLLVQLNDLSNRAGTDWQGLMLAASNGDAAAAAAPAPTTPAPAPEAAAPPAEGSTAEPTTGAAPATGTTTTATATTPAPATETAAATLPIGATVGSAGLPTLPYDLAFTGGFFEIADFIGELDNTIDIRDDSGQVSVNGRLATLDGFALKGGAPGSSPILDAGFRLTTYVTPEEQGLTLGATPEGPAAVGQTPVTPAASVTP